MELSRPDRIVLVFVAVAFLVLGGLIAYLVFFGSDSHKDATSTSQRLVVFWPLNGDTHVSLAYHAGAFEVKGKPGGFKIARTAKELDVQYDDAPSKPFKFEIATAQCGISSDAQAMLRPKR